MFCKAGLLFSAGLPFKLVTCNNFLHHGLPKFQPILYLKPVLSCVKLRLSYPKLSANICYWHIADWAMVRSLLASPLWMSINYFDTYVNIFNTNSLIYLCICFSWGASPYRLSCTSMRLVCARMPFFAIRLISIAVHVRAISVSDNRRLFPIGSGIGERKSEEMYCPNICQSALLWIRWVGISIYAMATIGCSIRIHETMTNAWQSWEFGVPFKTKCVYSYITGSKI